MNLRWYCVYLGTKTNQILSHGNTTRWNYMTAETQISSTATQNKVRHDVVCLCMIIERGKERWQKREKEVREHYKVKEKIAHLYPEAGESGTSLRWIKCKIENRVLTKQTDYWGIDINADYLIESKWQFYL